jgi:hypothetical protein
MKIKNKKINLRNAKNQFEKMQKINLRKCKKIKLQIWN